MSDVNSDNTQRVAQDRHRVVVVGSGFGGLFGTKALRRADVDVTMIARTSHHLFQPLLYQVATGILSEGEIAPPTREILAHQRNAKVMLGEVTDVDLQARTVTHHELGAAKGEDVDHLLSFVVVGAGPTGVEMAGQIAELARHTLHRDFRYINTRHARVILIDAASQVLPPFGKKLGEK